MHPIAPRHIVCLLALGIAACSGDAQSASGSSTGEPGTGEGGTAQAEDTGTTGAPLDPDAPKYYDDVLPIFTMQCIDCHTEGGIGPFVLDDYETAKTYGELIRLVTEHRSMPPFNASNTGECNSFEDARWLTQEEIDTIAAWVDGGLQEGDPNVPQPEPPAPETLLGDDIEVIQTPAGYLPRADDASESGLDDYQCFLVDPGVEGSARFLTGFEVLPGNPTVTHHLVAFQVDPAADALLGGSNGELMQQLDEASPDQPGWDCFGAAGQGVLVGGTPVTWAPGGGAFNFPEGTGIRFEPGEVLVVQMHYNLVNGNGEDQTEVHLSWADSVEREAVNALLDEFLISAFNGNPVTIPAGDAGFVYAWDERISAFHDAIAGWEKVEILGMLPHMHELGTRMQVNIVGSTTDESQCGIYVDRWDFDWQRAFMYQQPLVVSPSDRLHVLCEWDASSRTNDVYPGLGTGNEMCLIGVYAAEAK